MKERTMTTEYNASEIDRLVREGMEDNDRMTPGERTVGEVRARRINTEDEHEAAATLRAAPVISGQTEPCGPPIDVIIPFGRAFSDARGIARTRNNLAATVAQLSAAKEEVDKLRGEIAMLLANADADTHLLTDAIRDRDRLAAEVERLTNERDAYRKAKQENDERFMIERNEAQTECERLAGERDRLSVRVRELELTEEDREALEFARERVSFNLNCSVASEYFSDEYADRHRHALALLDRLVKGGR